MVVSQKNPQNRVLAVKNIAALVKYLCKIVHPSLQQFNSTAGEQETCFQLFHFLCLKSSNVDGKKRIYHRILA